MYSKQPHPFRVGLFFLEYCPDKIMRILVAGFFCALKKNYICPFQSYSYDENIQTTDYLLISDFQYTDALGARCPDR
jgi:hypothetical protein